MPGHCQDVDSRASVPKVKQLDTIQIELTSALLAEFPSGGYKTPCGPTSCPSAETQSPYQNEHTGCPLEPWKLPVWDLGALLGPPFLPLT